MQLRHLFPVVVASAAFLYACDDHDEPETVGDVLLEGVVTDEAYLALDAALSGASAQTDATRAPTLDSLADGAALPSATIPTFSWHFGSTTASPASVQNSRDAALSFFSAPALNRVAAIDYSTPLRWLLSPVSPAYAHGDPFNGTGTFLVFSTDSSPNLVRVFTSNTTYTPSADSWAKMKGAGAPIMLKLVSAIFESNRVAQDGGPFDGSSTTFTVTP